MELTTYELYNKLNELWNAGARLHYYNGSTWDIELNKKRYNLDNNTKMLTINEGVSADDYFKSSTNILENELDSFGRNVEFGRLLKVAMLSALHIADDKVNARDTIPYNIDMQDAF